MDGLRPKICLAGRDERGAPKRLLTAWPGWIWPHNCSERGREHRNETERGMRVLISDGDEAFLIVARRYLSHHGHKVKTLAGT